MVFLGRKEQFALSNALTRFLKTTSERVTLTLEARRADMTLCSP